MTASFMVPGQTISILAVDERDGALGMAIAATAVAVGARCPHIVAGGGVASSQGFANPKLGPLALDLLRRGLDVDEVMNALRRHDRWMEFRQVAIVSAGGAVQAHTGVMTTGWAGHVAAPGMAALANGLPDPGALAAVQRGFRDADAVPLDRRLLGAIEAGRDALGASVRMMSSALLVRSAATDVRAGSRASAHLDLRIDLAGPAGTPDAVDDLRRLLDVYGPLAGYYERRQVAPEPETSPSNLGENV